MSSTLLWCCLFFNFPQLAVWENLSVLDLALSGMKGFLLSADTGTYLMFQWQECLEVLMTTTYGLRVFVFIFKVWFNHPDESSPEKDSCW